MSNTVSYAQKFAQALDKVKIAGATSGWMEENADNALYSGGNTVKLPKISTLSGLGNYSRSTGFATGSATFTYETETLSQERGRKFFIDRVDVDETNFALTAENLLGEFTNREVNPELDAYRYSKIAKYVLDKDDSSLALYGKTLSLKQLLKDIAAVEDKIGEDTPLIVSINRLVWEDINTDSNITKYVDIRDFTQGGITTKVKAIDNAIIRPVPSARMKTTYTFKDGVTNSGGNDQRAGGFEAASSAKNINWLITPAYAPRAVAKVQNVRIFEPGQNLDLDAYQIDYRLYHDLFISDNDVDNCLASIKESKS